MRVFSETQSITGYSYNIQVAQCCNRFVSQNIKLKPRKDILLHKPTYRDYFP